MRVLFVDDETRVLEALERALFQLADGWETRYVSSGAAALNELSQQPYDVVVSELHLAGLDGATLLTRIAAKYPRTVRIVLSGHSDEEAALKLVRVAHQFLAKPCAAATLHQIIARTARLTQLLPDRKLQTLVGQIGSLPSTPEFHARLAEIAEQSDAASAVSAMTRAIEQDPAASAKLLQVASSAFFNSAASVSDIESAVMRLGLRTLRHLWRALGDGAASRPSAQPTMTAVRQIQQRSLDIARLASRMARLPEDATAAYIAGLLCDIGQLVLVSAAPERLYITQAEAAHSGVADHQAELATWNVTHAEIGAYLLGLWGLPFQIVEAVANHHAPARSDDDRLGLPQLVWLASCIVNGEEPAPELLHRFGAEELYATQRRASRKGEPDLLRNK